MLCHEAPEKPAYAVGEVEEFLDEAIRFTKALEEVLAFEMFGLTPLTQGEMTAAAAENLGKKEEELNHLLTEIRAKVGIADDARSRRSAPSTDGSRLHSFDDAQGKWLSYRNAHCDF